MQIPLIGIADLADYLVYFSFEFCFTFFRYSSVVDWWNLIEQIKMTINQKLCKQSIIMPLSGKTQPIETTVLVDLIS